MRPRGHIIYGLLTSIIISIFFNLGMTPFLIIFSSSILIDLDHVTRYIIKTRNFSPKKFFQYSEKTFVKLNSLSPKEKTKYKYPFFIFHGIEALIIFFLLSKFSAVFLYIFIGFTIHLFLDYCNIIKHKTTILIKTSQLYTLLRNRKKKELPI